MAKLISKTDESSVCLLNIEISEDELELFIASLGHLLDKLSDSEIENITGADRDEMEGIRDDLLQLSPLKTERGMALAG